MTINEVRKLWDEMGASDSPHECPDEEFTRCEVCEASTAARHKLEWAMPQIVEMLLKATDLLADSYLQMSRVEARDAELRELLGVQQ